MDRENQIIIDMERIIQAIDAFRDYGTPPELIVKRIYHLAEFERQQAQRRIDERMDELERMWADGAEV